MMQRSLGVGAGAIGAAIDRSSTSGPTWKVCSEPERRILVFWTSAVGLLVLMLLPKGAAIAQTSKEDIKTANQPQQSANQGGPARALSSQAETPLKTPNDLIKLFDKDSVPLKIDEGTIGVYESQSLCGVNCAYIILHQCGRGVSYRELLEAAGTVPDSGLSIAEVKRLCGVFGLNCEVLRGNMGALEKLKPPAVLYLGDPDDTSRSGHFVVFSRWAPGHPDSDRWLEVVDGTSGARNVYPLNSGTWSRNFSGFIIRPMESARSLIVPWVTAGLALISGGVWLITGIRYASQAARRARLAKDS